MGGCLIVFDCISNLPSLPYLIRSVSIAATAIFQAKVSSVNEFGLRPLTEREEKGKNEKWQRRKHKSCDSLRSTLFTWHGSKMCIHVMQGWNDKTFSGLRQRSSWSRKLCTGCLFSREKYRDFYTVMENDGEMENDELWTLSYATSNVSTIGTYLAPLLYKFYSKNKFLNHCEHCDVYSRMKTNS